MSHLTVITEVPYYQENPDLEAFPSWEAWWLTLVESDRLMLREAREAIQRNVESALLDPFMEYVGDSYGWLLVQSLTKIANQYGQTFEDLLWLQEESQRWSAPWDPEVLA